MIKFKVVKEMGASEWDDHIFGSGAFQWEWWRDCGTKPDGDIVLVAYSDADDPESNEVTSWRGTYQELADIASDLASVDPFVANQLNSDDFDADGMDRVCQVAVFGQVRYS